MWKWVVVGKREYRERLEEKGPDSSFCNYVHKWQWGPKAHVQNKPM